MPYLEVNGRALCYELTGSGSSTMVLLHEMGGSLRAGMRWRRGWALSNASCVTTRAALPTGHDAAMQTPEILTTAVLDFIATSGA